MFDKLTNPILFQGNLKKKPYFEGWYFKQVSADERQIVSLIPGISLNKAESHSFVQYIVVLVDKNQQKITRTGYVEYPIEAFTYQNDPFQITIGSNIFTESGVSVHLKDEQITIVGSLDFGPLYPIEKSFFTPNIMGAFAYIPKMECSHGVISMNHAVRGSLLVNGKQMELTHGKGYIEKDWGSAFPREYVWIQSNHFQNPSTSVFFSEAYIPFLGSSFEGFICNLVMDNKEYRFATYRRDKCKLEKINADTVKVKLENKEACLTLEASIMQQGELKAPTNDGMHKTIKEGLSGKLRLQLELKKEKRTYTDVSVSSGIEIVEHNDSFMSAKKETN
ncbi:hypothetical protein JHE06_08450 [Carnobacterium sp. CS13]|uniref:tocopherol cyclase family protein n=1 Tax=Carnobacterium sp. CS13 TaxID=2800128 RepID=UPI0019114921|nr:tocopherol cyclase family protein [Carnobacterium sp. CS13]QQP69641.1 hypothetical protein JHE06_08450 [Carnobacterium sp. CS13]